MPQRFNLLVAALAFPALFLAPAAAAEGVQIEKTVNAPHQYRIPLEITHEKATLMSVESHNEPTEGELAKAREKDPDDVTHVGIRFYYRNDGFVKRKIKVRVALLDAEGLVLAEGGRGGTLDPQKEEDTFSFPVKVKTLDWPRASKIKVLATFLP